MRKSYIVLGLIALVVAGVLILPTAIQQGTNGQLKVAFFDSEGNRVADNYAWYVSGVEVASMDVTVTWSSTGNDIDWSTFSATGTIVLQEWKEVWNGEESRTYWADIATESISSTEPNGQFSTSFVFDDLLDSSSQSSWTLRVRGQLTGSVYDIYGNKLDVGWADEYQFTVSYEADAGTFSFSAGWNL